MVEDGVVVAHFGRIKQYRVGVGGLAKPLQPVRFGLRFENVI